MKDRRAVNYQKEKQFKSSEWVSSKGYNKEEKNSGQKEQLMEIFDALKG